MLSWDCKRKEPQTQAEHGSTPWERGDCCCRFTSQQWLGFISARKHALLWSVWGFLKLEPSWLVMSYYCMSLSLWVLGCGRNMLFSLYCRASNVWVHMREWGTTESVLNVCFLHICWPKQRCPQSKQSWKQVSKRLWCRSKTHIHLATESGFQRQRPASALIHLVLPFVSFKVSFSVSSSQIHFAFPQWVVNMSPNTNTQCIPGPISLSHTHIQADWTTSMQFWSELTVLHTHLPLIRSGPGFTNSSI